MNISAKNAPNGQAAVFDLDERSELVVANRHPSPTTDRWMLADFPFPYCVQW
jgi:hypothetical protein